MNSANTDPTARAEQLRAALADYIKSWGTLRTPQVEAALRTVPRHLVLPRADLDIAYGRKPVVTRRAADSVRHEEPAEHLNLWLATTTSNFARLTVGPHARTSDLADPAPRWAGAARYDGGTLAYLTARELHDDVNELGVIVHGPDSATLAAHTTDLRHQWDHQRPSQPTITAHQTDSPTDLSHIGARIARPHTVITIAW